LVVWYFQDRSFQSFKSWRITWQWCSNIIWRRASKSCSHISSW